MGTSFGSHSQEDIAYIAKVCAADCEDLTDFEQMLRAGDIILLFSLFLVKAAVIWLCRRLFSINQKTSKVFCDVALVLSAVWCVGSIAILSAQCDPEAAIGAGNGTCSGLVRASNIRAA